MLRKVVPIVPSHNQEAEVPKTSAKSKPRRSNPRSMEEFIRLCKKHGNRYVTEADSDRADNCPEGTQAFSECYLSGGKKVLLRKLIHFIENDHSYWREVMWATQEMLRRIGAVKEDYWYDDYGVKEPINWIEVDLGRY